MSAHNETPDIGSEGWYVLSIGTAVTNVVVKHGTSDRSADCHYQVYAIWLRTDLDGFVFLSVKWLSSLKGNDTPYIFL